MPKIADLLLVLLLTVVLPIYGTVTWKSFQQEVQSRKPNSRMRAYVETLAMECILLLILLVLWLTRNRPFLLLGVPASWNLSTLRRPHGK